jgi:hypothetical protein
MNKSKGTVGSELKVRMSGSTVELEEKLVTIEFNNFWIPDLTFDLLRLRYPQTAAPNSLNHHRSTPGLDSLDIESFLVKTLNKENVSAYVPDATGDVLDNLQYHDLQASNCILGSSMLRNSWDGIIGGWNLCEAIRGKKVEPAPSFIFSSVNSVCYKPGKKRGSNLSHPLPRPFVDSFKNASKSSIVSFKSFEGISS